jgi:hypothetical protein
VGACTDPRPATEMRDAGAITDAGVGGFFAGQLRRVGPLSGLVMAVMTASTPNPSQVPTPNSQTSNSHPQTHKTRRHKQRSLSGFVVGADPDGSVIFVFSVANDLRAFVARSQRVRMELVVDAVEG